MCKYTSMTEWWHEKSNEYKTDNGIGVWSMLIAAETCLINIAIL